MQANLTAGASGFILKDTPPEELIAAVRTVANGGALLAPSITKRLINVLNKLELRDRAQAQAIIFAYESGMVTIGQSHG